MQQRWYRSLLQQSPHCGDARGARTRRLDRNDSTPTTDPRSPTTVGRSDQRSPGNERVGTCPRPSSPGGSGFASRPSPGGRPRRQRRPRTGSPRSKTSSSSTAAHCSASPATYQTATCPNPTSPPSGSWHHCTTCPTTTSSTSSTRHGSSTATAYDAPQSHPAEADSIEQAQVTAIEIETAVHDDRSSARLASAFRRPVETHVAGRTQAILSRHPVEQLRVHTCLSPLRSLRSLGDAAGVSLLGLPPVVVTPSN